MISYGNIWNIDGKSTDEKPVGKDVPNGSVFYEMDTGKVFKFDAEARVWIEQ